MTFYCLCGDACGMHENPTGIIGNIGKCTAVHCTCPRYTPNHKTDKIRPYQINFLKDFIFSLFFWFVSNLGMDWLASNHNIGSNEDPFRVGATFIILMMIIWPRLKKCEATEKSERLQKK